MVSAVFILSACQSVPLEPFVKDDSGATWLDDPAYFASRDNEIQQQPSWRYSAKVGLTAPQLKEQANLLWEFADQTNNIRLFGPLGVGAIKLQFDDHGVVLSDNKGRSYQGGNAEELLTRIAGWPIPIDALSSWIFVSPQKGSVFRYVLDENQRVKLLEQLGWRIEYSDYREYAGSFMPRKVVATKRLPVKRNALSKRANTPGDGVSNKIIVKLITKGWKQ